MKRDAIIEQQLIEQLEANPRKKFLCWQLAERCGLISADCSPILESLVERNVIGRESNGRSPMYFSGAVQRAAPIQNRVYTPKVYELGAGFDRVREQIADLRSVPSRHI